MCALCQPAVAAARAAAAAAEAAADVAAADAVPCHASAQRCVLTFSCSLSVASERRMDLPSACGASCSTPRGGAGDPSQAGHVCEGWQARTLKAGVSAGALWACAGCSMPWGWSSQLVAGSVHLSTYTGRGVVAMWWSGLLGLRCSLIDLPCFQLLLVAMLRRELLNVSRSGQFLGLRGSLPVVRFSRPILSWLLASSGLGSVVANLGVEVLGSGAPRGLLELQHGTGHGGCDQLA